MNPNPKFPRAIAQDASREALAEFLADLIEWLVKYRRNALTQAGISEADLFQLRRAAKAYRDDNLTPADFDMMKTLIDKLDDVEMYL